MPFKFSTLEYKDILKMYIRCDYNSLASKGEYAQRFPNRRTLSCKVFQDTYQRFCETGNSDLINIGVNREMNMENADIAFNIVTNEPTISTRRIASRTGISKSAVHRYLKLAGILY